MATFWDPVAVFDVIRPTLPEALVSARRLEDCRSIAASLPPSTVSYYLECRLEDGEDQVDFLTMVRDREAADRFESRLGGQASAPAWRATLELFRLWNSDPAFSRTPFFWLEYDLDHHFQRSAPLASPGFCLEPDYLTRCERTPAVNSDLAWDIGQAGLALLVRSGVDCSSLVALQHCLRCLPPEGSLIHVSAMLARTPCTTKFYVAVPRGSVVDYLGRIGWPGSMGIIGDVLARRYRPSGETAFLDITVGDAVGPRLGLAFSQFNGKGTLAPDSAWEEGARDKVSPSKREALRTWWGVTVSRLDGLRTWVYRWLDIKLVIDERGAVTYKAYLGFMPTLPPPFA